MEFIALVAGFVIALVTAPVGVSGAVFLLPVQLSVLGVPNPQVTPTNLLYNVVAGPGALIRYLRRGQMDMALAWAMILGSAPGVIAGAFIRVYIADDPTVFRLIAASVLLPTGLFILAATYRPTGKAETNGQTLQSAAPKLSTITALALGIGVVGGIYGIGGGSVLAPLLVGAGMTVARVAPAALASTWVASIIGVLTYAVIALHAPGAVAPDWHLGIAAGIGGLAGGYVGAHLQPRLPERSLRLVLGFLAICLAGVYAAQALG